MGSSPIVGFDVFPISSSSLAEYITDQGQCPERQRGRTVTPLAIAFVGSSPTWPTDFDAQCHTALSILIKNSAHVAQSAERILGKNEVMGSNPIVGFLPRSLLTMSGVFL